ncbi:MAG TPA: oxygen-independent coproporphyrinogen III oxidase [Kofleriaceae bacterium]|jgi:oxygen-independent coproporphyrinogen-3 oxidase|nr:oxygen-independent coproporphyrinogen III oxidase [Kofleriaceae bacterium]
MPDVVTDTDPDPAACLAEYASRGPRYTSYPPATEFGPVSADRVKRELATIGERSTPVSLYVHIPFCKSLCWYCGCNVIATRNEERGNTYLEQLATEMALLSESLHGAPVTEIAIGGGSPNFLAPKSLRTLCAVLDGYFAVTPDARRSIELDPRTTTSSQVDVLAAAQFRSLSMGVQDFSESVQDAIHRHQTRRQTRWLVDRARMVGFDDINVDVVYGLPLQTETSFAATLDAVIDLSPDRIALFGYAHLPDKLPHQRLVERAGRVLDSYERATLLLLGIDKLTRAGYIHLGLDHFARPESRLARAAAEHRMIRTFQGYAERRAEAILGLGVSAISSTPRMHWQNHAELPAWERSIWDQAQPIARGVELDDDDRIRRTVIDRLMCDGEADLDQIGHAHGIDAAAYFARELQALGALGEIAAYDRDARVVRTTELGRLLVRNVCMVFDRYHQVHQAVPHTGEAHDPQPRFSPTI